MAQTIDTTITDNLSGIIRLMETGPKICQKYIEHPALFKGKKFGIRYVVLVCSMDPLEIFVCGVLGVCTYLCVVNCGHCYVLKTDIKNYIAENIIYTMHIKTVISFPFSG